MERERIKIVAPEIVRDGNKSILRSQILDGAVEKKLDYGVDIKYEKYLTCERSDAFVIAVLYYAMLKNKDIEWDTPCSQQLIFQLQTYFIPTYAMEIPSMHSIELIGPTTTEHLSQERGGVATGISNGVDSCYTIRKYLDIKYSEYRLTHLLFTDNTMTRFPKDYQEEFLKHYLTVLPQCAEELGLEFIFVEFHLNPVFPVGCHVDPKCGSITDGDLGTLMYCSLALALQKLIRVYYFSSSYSISDFSMTTMDMSHHDILTLPLISTETTRFISSGVEVKRVDKVSTIADWPYAQKYLQTCVDQNDTNCGYCGKCVRTMTELYAIGHLDNFKRVFPVDDYMKHINGRLAYIIAEGKLGHSLYSEAIQEVRKNGIKIPIGAYLLTPYYYVKEFARDHLKNVQWARKIYRDFNLQRIVYRHRKFNNSDYNNNLEFYKYKKTNSEK